MLSPDLEAISNRGENKFFLKTALAWKGSVTPKVLPRILVTLAYAALILVSYPLFSLDEIGAELQNPFSPRNLSHLPLTKICQTIESNVLAVDKQTKE